MKLNFSRHVLPAVAVVAIIVSLVLVFRTQPDRTLAQPMTTPATNPTANRPTVAGAGVIEPSSELIEIAALVPGVVDRLYVEAGQRVAAGAPLFSVDSREARAAVAEAEARLARSRQNIAAAQTSLGVARRQFALYQSAGDPRAVSRQEVITSRGTVEDASARVAVAQAEAREAQAQLEAARVTLARHTVRAPRSATVLQVRTRPGEYANAGPNAGDPLIAMGVTEPLHVRIDIDENEIERVALGRPAVISPRGAANQRTPVTFVRAEPLVVPKRSLTNAATERVDVRVLQLIYALPGANHGYFVGQQVDGFVPAKGGGR
ncbi:efflux RND transporter periplasmic adaptor subunit [Sphingomonas lenta]|uniref:Uncharacterized protein n=1 Tax=Sphingomonas lenta TaxID=1141887 RepID=A0A2A2SGY3_9SPHN|nr:efflux RND transporter periplasmic adaptor subunit [Sphingomonas lenta]PAX08554.1 hypothetical protein CKY28_04035 [Sphingomonas lenta]